MAAAFYSNVWIQIFVAGLIVGNFITNLCEKTIDPRGNKYEDTWKAFELFYNIAFTIELAINMYAFWLCDFWKSGWNIFDFVVVTIGLLTQFEVPLPGPFKMLRMMRAFRVFRLFKRIKSLNKIMVSLARAVPGVLNAFLILFIVMCIYAILAVEFFADHGRGGVYLREDGCLIPLVTSRGQDWGHEYFGNFHKSLYTMFQVLTGESWSEAIAKPLVHSDTLVKSIGSAFFFVSYFIVSSIVLVNVVIAILLDQMVSGDDDGTEKCPGEAPEAGHRAKELVDAADGTADPENVEQWCWQRDATEGGSRPSTSGAPAQDGNEDDLVADLSPGPLGRLISPLQPSGREALAKDAMEAELRLIGSDIASLKGELATILAALSRLPPKGGHVK